MRALTRLAWVELKLFLREPLTVLFAVALPLIVLFILGGVFGDTPEADVFRGVGPITYYTPAYIGVVLSSIGLISVPVHLAGNRERGVLKRYRASSVPAAAVLGSQLVVSAVIGTVSAVVVVLAARAGYGVDLAADWPGSIAAYLLALGMFGTIGVMLGALLPGARTAQALGLILWFVMLFLGGAGPPPEVLNDTMRLVADFLPLTYVISLLQGPWLDLGWDAGAMAVVLGIGAVAAVLTIRFFRWEVSR